jgi:hypothetical protein
VGDHAGANGVAELLQSLDVVALGAFDVALLEIIGTQLVVWALVA